MGESHREGGYHINTRGTRKKVTEGRASLMTDMAVLVRDGWDSVVISD